MVIFQPEQKAKDEQYINNTMVMMHEELVCGDIELVENVK